MTLTDAEVTFLNRQPRGHLATVGPGGTPQVKPLGFTYNATLGTIDIAGFNMGGSAKYRNVQTNPKVAFVVDEVTEASIEGAHFLEIRGVAETATATATEDFQGHLPPEIIRIHPRRIISFNVDPATRSSCRLSTWRPIHHLAQFGSLCLEQARSPSHHDFLGLLPDLQGEQQVHRDAALYVDVDPVSYTAFLKPGFSTVTL